MFKTLCEVKLLHEYYLTERDGNTIFDIPDREGRIRFLSDKLQDNYPTINDDLTYEVSSHHQNIFSGHQLKLLPTYSGFQIVVAVVEKQLTGGVKAFEPKISLPDDLAITILLLRKNSKIDTISNSNLRNSIPSCYFFSNETMLSGKTNPFLALSPAERNLSFAYEQGNLALDSFDNMLKAYYIDKSGFDQWATVKGEGFVTEADRMVVPTRFYYSFDKNSGINSASFTLIDNNGNIVKTIEQRTPDSAMQVLLDFSEEITDTLFLSGISKSMIYFLKISADNGLYIEHNIVFSSFMPSHCWAVVALRPNVAETEYSLLDNDGLIATRIETNGDIVSPRVFEIRIKSRFTFWRYLNNKQKKLKANPILNPYLEYDVQKGFMESISLRNATYVPTVFKDGTTSKFLPNPSSYEILKAENKRVYTEIPVPRSDLFDV
ncbi:MAG: hypothetical protein ABI691_06135 [Ginsengibacter sp.]